MNNNEYINRYKREHYKRIYVDIKKDVAKQFDQKVDKNNMTKAEILRDCIEKYLRED